MSDKLIAEQIRYYRARAPEYDATVTPDGDPLALFGEDIQGALAAFAPTGNVLELACGTGIWTQLLAEHAQRITALDSSPEMIELARARVADERVRFVRADLFQWEPPERYDAVVFANWLSHVPFERFAAFWSLVARSLAEGGRVFFVDEAHDAWRHEQLSLGEDFVGRPGTPVVRRTLRDGSSFNIFKVFWDPAELEARLGDLGWDIAVHPSGPFFWGAGRSGRAGERRRASSPV
jgi:demethylmenaquinone methyltransferase/2-methoxy-6-polyprenyl-1,4-benzoquinol methylase